MLTLTKNKNIEIPIEDPFKYDMLDRKKEVKNLSKIIEAINQPFVLSINGQWGSGKTTFIHLWKSYLDANGYVTLYYNSWENDSSKDPLISIIGEIQQQITKRFNQQGLTRIFNRLKKTSGKILLKSIPTAIKIGTYGLLDIKSDAKIEQGLAELFSNLPGEYVKYKDERENFRKTLTAFSHKLKENHNLIEGKKIVILIDELDRCRPTFAIELLESIKHFFSIESYVFILAIDKTQLGCSLRTLYGTEMDYEGYLRRFIDYNYNLANPEIESFISLLYHTMGFEGIFERKYLSSSRPKLFLEMLKGYCIGFKLSLRDVEQLFFQLKIIIPQIDFEVLHNLYTIPLLIVLRIKHFDVYQSLIEKKSDSSDVVSMIKSNKVIQAMFDRHPNDHLHLRVEEFLKIITVTSVQDRNELMIRYQRGIQADPTNFPLEVYGGLDQIVKYAYDNQTLNKIRDIIEFSSKVY